jgi:hypothetical protein
MAEDDDLPVNGSGPRLLTVSEAAAILQVSEQPVRDWIADDLISYETLPSGERRLHLTDEARHRSLSYGSSMYVLDLRSGVSDEKAGLLGEQLPARRREHQLHGLVWTELNLDALTALLAARLSEVCPDPESVRAERGMVWVAGAGIDVAQLASDDEQSVERRLISLAEQALETASEALSEITAEPWPAKAGMFPGGFPPIHARISDGSLFMSYGEPDAPILELRPIRLAEIIARQT